MKLHKAADELVVQRSQRVSEAQRQMDAVKDVLYKEFSGDWGRVFRDKRYDKAFREFRRQYDSCPECGPDVELHMVGYDPMWQDGDLHCESCGAYVRGFDAG